MVNEALMAAVQSPPAANPILSDFGYLSGWLSRRPRIVMLGKIGKRFAVLAALVMGPLSGASAADDGIWSVQKSSGEVWLATSGAQQVSLGQEETLKPGDTIRTGRNGRVLLVRGEESILISPNSVVGVPAEKKDGLSTTIVQQAGSILLEVEKRNVKHFEVETPYLAAVVKGTQFSVTVAAGSTRVGVIRGQVEVSDFKTGQIARVMPGQAATVFEHGKSGLNLSGTGTFNPIEQGKPRASAIDRIPVPKSGLSAPRNAANGHAIHAVGPTSKALKAAGLPSSSHQAPKAGVVRISSSLGEVKLNFHKVTQGLAHGAVGSGQVRNANASVNPETIWSDGKTNAAASNSAIQTTIANGSGSTSASAGAASAASATIAATVAGASSDGSGSGKGNSDDASEGRGRGTSGATGNGKGNNGNGYGNGGGDGSNGNGHAYGRNRH
jgi:hypothetical protein